MYFWAHPLPWICQCCHLHTSARSDSKMFNFYPDESLYIKCSISDCVYGKLGLRGISGTQIFTLVELNICMIPVGYDFSGAYQNYLVLFSPYILRIHGIEIVME
ncbi:unnamed protein product [Owenia fusiformis]|uniref:Uncharacterized protein n=1 Tax=Owenia fusiformis TaxID=6347 RepID=A0A8S4MZY6_OWEFU|nr:unnamed protein product [Owenia fusiformis]